MAVPVIAGKSGLNEPRSYRNYYAARPPLRSVQTHTHTHAGISRRDNELYLWSSRLKSTRGNGYKRRLEERCLIAVAA